MTDSWCSISRKAQPRHKSFLYQSRHQSSASDCFHQESLSAFGLHWPALTFSLTFSHVKKPRSFHRSPSQHLLPPSFALFATYLAQLDQMTLLQLLFPTPTLSTSTRNDNQEFERLVLQRTLHIFVVVVKILKTHSRGFRRNTRSTIVDGYAKRKRASATSNHLHLKRSRVRISFSNFRSFVFPTLVLFGAMCDALVNSKYLTNTP